MTVRFTHRLHGIYGAGYWRKGKIIYEEQKYYSPMNPFVDLRIVRDFLPSRTVDYQGRKRQDHHFTEQVQR
jgi:hypothetical protein